MATIRRAITVRAPVARVFDYLADPTHLPALWPSLVAVRNVVATPAGPSFDWDYKLLGMTIHGHSDAVEMIQNERLVARSVTGIPNTFRWLFARHGDLTEAALEVDYQVPMLGRLAEGIVGRVHEREAQTLLANLKRTLES
jgi:uncharacterized membrane protein